MAQPDLSASAGYAEGKPAVGTIVRADLEALQAPLLGEIDRNNLKDGEVITAKLAASAVDTTKLGTNAVREDHVFFGEAGDGVLAVRCGPNYPQDGSAASAPRMVRCSVSYTGVVAGAGWETETDGIGPHNFSTICTDGNPAFTGTPTMLGAPVITANDGVDGDLPDIIAVNAISATQITLAIHYPAGATVQTFTLEWGMLGPMS